jgi:hypothetical protein
VVISLPAGSFNTQPNLALAALVIDAGSAQNGCADAVDDIRPEFTLWRSFALTTRSMTLAPLTSTLALLLNMLIVALKGRRHWPGYLLLLLALLLALLLVV